MMRTITNKARRQRGGRRRGGWVLSCTPSERERGSERERERLDVVSGDASGRWGERGACRPHPRVAAWDRGHVTLGSRFVFCFCFSSLFWRAVLLREGLRMRRENE
jgi:hypothetical protein